MCDGETLIIIVRHPKHQDNEITEYEAERVRKQGRRLLGMGLKPEDVAVVVASQQPRSQKTARFIQDGIGSDRTVTVSPFMNALEEIGPEDAKDFKAAALATGQKPWEVLARRSGEALCAQFDIPNRLVRATRAATVWTTLGQLNPGKAVIVSDHTGQEIEVAIELAKAVAKGQRIWKSKQLADPCDFVQTASVVLMKLDSSSGTLIDGPFYFVAPE